MIIDLSKLIDYDLLAYFKSKLDTVLAGKVDAVSGKGLSSNDYTSEDKAKLTNIAAGAQVNVLEGIQRNGQTVTPVNKIANIAVPTKTSDLTNDSHFITVEDVPEGSAASTTTPLMDGTASVGTETTFARGDHRHPSDTSKANAADVYTKTEIDNKLSSVFKPGGSVAFQNLPALSAANLGKILNVTDDFTTTADFVEGAGKTYPAGTNVAIVDVGSAGSPSYKYDIQGSFFDLSGYAEDSDFGLATTSEIDALFT